MAVYHSLWQEWWHGWDYHLLDSIGHSWAHWPGSEGLVRAIGGELFYGTALY